MNLIHHIKTSFLGISSSAIVSNTAKHGSNDTTNNNDLICEVLDHAIVPHINNIDQPLDCQEVEAYSPESGSGDFADNLLREESNLIDDIDREAAEIQSWHFKDDANSNGLNNSMSSSDCVSQTREYPGTVVPFLDEKKENDNFVHENQECNQQKQDNIHYQSVLSSLLKGSHQFILGPHVGNGNRESSFRIWDRISSGQTLPKVATPQRLLKKVLLDVARLHKSYRIESGKEGGKKDDLPRPPEVDDVDRNHVLSERKRREKMNERFMILGKLVPSGGKVPKYPPLLKCVCVR